MKFTATLKQALALHFVAAAVLPILLLAIFSSQYFTRKHFDAISNLLNAHVQNVANEATECLRDTNTILMMVAKMIDGERLHGRERINEHLQIALEKSYNFESIYVLDNDKRVIHLGLAETNAGNINDYMGLDMSAHSIFRGRTVLTQPTWSDTFLSTITVEPSITLGIPLRDGTLLGTVSLQRLTEALVERLGHISHNFHFALLDHHGVVIADSRPGITSQRINLRLHPEVRNALDSQIEVSGKYHEDNSLMESVRVVPETGWAAYVSLPVNEVLAEVRPLNYLLMSVLAFAAFLGGVFSFWSSRRMLKPVVLLRDATAEVARGNYDQNLPSVTYKELDDLGNSFNAMLKAVQERESSLEQSQARYLDLVNSIDGIVWELEVETFRFTFVSEQAEKVLGYPAQRWLEEQGFWKDHVHEDDRGWVVSFCIAETEAKRDHDFEYRMIAADGRVVWLKDLVSVIVEDGRPVRLSGVMLDITRRKNAEIELRETADRLKLLIERMPFGCIMWDPELRVELWNPAAEAIFGYRQAEVQGRHPDEFLIPDTARENVENNYARLARGDLPANSINENFTKDGHIITCEWHNTPLRNPDGSPAGAISMVDDISERIHAENSLRESEARFRAVFETNPDAVLISRFSDGRFVSLNDHCSIMCGYTRDEMIGKTSLELGLWVNPEQRRLYVETVQEKGLVENFEMKLRSKNGRERIGLASARTLLLNDELCLLSVIRDVTEMKEAEIRMARSESRFRSLVSVLGEGILILGFNGEIVQCNKAAERILKMTADEMVGKFHDEINPDALRENGAVLPPEEHPATYTLETGKPVQNLVMGLPQENGDIVWLQVNTQALGLDKSGKPVAVVVSFADVSGLKQVEGELRRSEQHLQALSRQFEGVLEAIPDRILILDNSLRVIWINWPEEAVKPGQDVASQNFRCDQLPGVVCSPRADSSSSLCDDCPVKKTFVSARSETIQKTLPDGRTLSLRTFPVTSELGEVSNVIAIAQDITDSLLQQAQSMRTGQLAALGELAAGVAHEINNPINGVINYAQLIFNKAAAESREHELSQRIIRESERIATIVRELLYFSREESQEVEQLSVEHALQEALALTKHQMNKEGILLEIDLPDRLPLIESRSHQVQRLFLNLISNARYALKQKYPEADNNKILRITATKVQIDKKSYVRIVFRDHGTGISREFLPRVMNPFVTTKPSSEGTGLGLSISHEIIQKHKGFLNINSVHGEFTEVVVDLPAKD
ncbi:MAG: PAS domain S-box protein [Desulfuromonadales bacterium]|nr:PAS domain S-box protein [Desulfuromonadales bacterium]